MGSIPSKPSNSGKQAGIANQDEGSVDNTAMSQAKRASERPAESLRKLAALLEDEEEQKQEREPENIDKEISLIKDQIIQLKEIQLWTDSVLSKNEAKLEQLFITQSPLLSLEVNLFENIVSFLGEEELLALEMASKCFDEPTAKSILEPNPKSSRKFTRWEKLDKRRYAGNFAPIMYMPKKRDRENFKEGEENARIRGHLFAKASAYAREMEELAASHFDFDCSDPIRLGSGICSGCDACQERAGVNRFVLSNLLKVERGDAIFLRLSHRERGLIWSGFCSDCINYSRNDECPIVLNEVIRCMNFKKKWPEFAKLWKRAQSKSTSHRIRKSKKYQAQLREVITSLHITVVRIASAFEESDNNASLLISTGGCHNVLVDKEATKSRLQDRHTGISLINGQSSRLTRNQERRSTSIEDWRGWFILFIRGEGHDYDSDSDGEISDNESARSSGTSPIFWAPWRGARDDSSISSVEDIDHGN